VRPEQADVRFVFATWRRLEEMVAQGRFRQDLYYRLRVVEIHVPPLRERGPEDLDRLIDHFLWTFSRRHHRPGLRLLPEARARLHGWRWPGNVRELQHVIEAATVLAAGPDVHPEDLPMDAPAPTSGPLGTLYEVEMAHIRAVLAACDGNRSQAARVLGIGRNTLNRKLGA
jgi:Nif-specific regulatory protein